MISVLPLALPPAKAAAETIATPDIVAIANMAWRLQYLRTQKRLWFIMQQKARKASRYELLSIPYFDEPPKIISSIDVYDRLYRHGQCISRYTQSISSGHKSSIFSELVFNHYANSIAPLAPSQCQNCCNFCGEVYGGKQLVCAIHPYGVVGDDCADFEGR